MRSSPVNAWRRWLEMYIANMTIMKMAEDIIKTLILIKRQAIKAEIIRNTREYSRAHTYTHTQFAHTLITRISTHTNDHPIHHMHPSRLFIITMSSSVPMVHASEVPA